MKGAWYSPGEHSWCSIINFLIYMNGLLHQITEGLLLQYADDTILICSGPTSEAVAGTMNSLSLIIGPWLVELMELNYSVNSYVVQGIDL